MAADPNAALKAELEELILATLEEKEIPDSRSFLSGLNRIDHHQVFESVLKSLQGFQFVSIAATDIKYWTLTEEGQTCAKEGSPEARIFNAIAVDGTTKNADLEQLLGKDMVKVGLGKVMKNKWAQVNKGTGTINRTVASIVDETQQQLIQLQNNQNLDDSAIANLKSRTLIKQAVDKTYAVTKGPQYRRQRKKEATDLTVDMIKSGAWAQSDFKEYNFVAKGAELDCGSLHPLMKVRAQIRNILFEMGFEEMPTNNFVESSFWNFDTLFQPQQHPARDSHDTFFLTNPKYCREIPDAKYCERVQEMHERGGHDSIGYRYEWSVNEARKNILRTHTTAVSSRMLYLLAQQPFVPKKYFSIDRVFRNETLDATHLAEFHQVEGLIADRNLTLGDLIGVIQTFFKKIDIDDVRFKPAYNPYTEPSMEIFTYSKELGRDVEIGNSGIFRPEMLKPMGLPDDVRVIAWGLSLERPTMVKYGLKNIRDLFGHSIKLSIIRENPICRYNN